MSFEVQKTGNFIDVPEGLPRLSKKDFENRTWVMHAVREIQAGRDVEEHFELIYKEHVPECRRLFCSFGLTEEVDDLVQEAMWRVYKGIGTFRLDSSFKTWLGHIVKNTARNAIRDSGTGKARTTSATESLDALVLSSDESGSPVEPESLSPDPLEEFLGSEREAELETVLLRLPPKMRQCMLFYYVHGYKQSEIAQLQETSVNTVKKQLVEGRKRLRPLFSVFAELFSLMIVLLLLVG